MTLNKIWIFRKLIQLKQLFDLNNDFDEDGTKNSIVSNSNFTSANAWGLVFAIFIASIGLQVNSTAVIIGAMLISPLMGPIVSTGYSLAVLDFNLLKKSATNLVFAIVISIFTSTLFFIISPVSSENSELMARTFPTFFDVLIAFFGGAAGIVALSRKNKSNAIPGVAIATALMPPLCTIGYGLSNLNISYALGAFYLFCINSVFICIATYIFVRLMGFSSYKYKSEEQTKNLKRWMTISAIIIIIPSFFTAWLLQRKQHFDMTVETFIKNELNLKNSVVAEVKPKYGFNKSSIDIKILGRSLSEQEISNLNESLKNKYFLGQTELKISNVDTLSLDQLQKKFITKSELLQIEQTQNELKIEHLKVKKKKLIDQTIKAYSPHIQKIDLTQEGPKIVWSKKISETKKELIEMKLIYKLNQLYNENLN